MRRRATRGNSQSIDLDLAGFGIIAVALSVAGMAVPAGRPTHLLTTLFLAVSGVGLGALNLRIELGVMSLSAIAIQAAAATLSPIEAAIVGAAATLPRSIQRRQLDRVPYSLMGAFQGAMGAGVGLVLLGFGVPQPFVAVAAVVTTVFASLVGTGLIGTRIVQASITEVWRRVMTKTMLTAYLFFIVASLLTVDLLSHGPIGYLEAATLFALSLPFVHTIFGRRWLRLLENQLSEADRLAIYGKAVEAALHGLRNSISTASSALENQGASNPDADNSVARMALADAKSTLASLTEIPQGEHLPAMVELDLGDIAQQTVAVTRYRAQAVDTAVILRQHPTTLLVLGHAVLLREAAANLVLNAIEAVPAGRIEIELGRRRDNWAYFQVRDNGKGLSDDQQRRLFQPYGTTKGRGGMGIGLFVSLAIVRQHFGRLYYEGSRKRGGIFTIALPPIDQSRTILMPSRRV